MNLEKIYIAHISFGNNPQTKVVMADSRDEALKAIEYMFPEQVIFCIVSVKETLDLRQSLEERQAEKDKIWYYFEPTLEENVFSSDVKDLVGTKEDLMRVHDNPMAIWMSYEQMVSFLDGLMSAIVNLDGRDLIIANNLK